MVEYLLPAALVGCVVLLALPMLDAGLLTSLINTLNQNGKTLQNKTFQVATMGSSPATATTEIRLQSGTVLTVGHIVQNFKSSIETLGADGTTEEMIATLREIAAKLNKSDDLSDIQANQLEALANAGHSLALRQGQIEELARNSKTIDDYLATDGKNLAAYMAHVTLVNFDSPYYRPTSELDPKTLAIFGLSSSPPASLGVDVFEFMKQYETVAQNGSLDDPAVNQLVTALSQQIKGLSGRVSGNQFYMWHDKAFGPQEMNQAIAADAESHLKSSIICTTGGTEDTGTSCPKY